MRVPIAIGAILALALVTACGGGTAATATPGGPTATPAAGTATPVAATPVAATATPAAAAIVCDASGEGGSVAIENFSYDPASATVATNGFVTWTNRDGATHTVTFDGGPNCGSLGGGASEIVQFTVAGTYPYHCNIHPDMKGTVEVS